MILARQPRTNVLMIANVERTHLVENTPVHAYWWRSDRGWAEMGLSIMGSFFMRFSVEFDTLDDDEQAAVLEWKLSL